MTGQDPIGGRAATRREPRRSGRPGRNTARTRPVAGPTDRESPGSATAPGRVRRGRSSWRQRPVPDARRGPAALAPSQRSGRRSGRHRLRSAMTGAAAGPRRDRRRHRRLPAATTGRCAGTRPTGSAPVRPAGPPAGRPHTGSGRCCRGRARGWWVWPTVAGTTGPAGRAAVHGSAARRAAGAGAPRPAAAAPAVGVRGWVASAAVAASTSLRVGSSAPRIDACPNRRQIPAAER